MHLRRRHTGDCLQHYEVSLMVDQLINQFLWATMVCEDFWLTNLVNPANATTQS